MNVKIVNKSECILPEYVSGNASGMDLRAYLIKPYYLHSGQRVQIPTGLYVELPVGFEAQIRPRSGLAYKNGITVLNSPGTIDADYRGEIGVILINHSEKSYRIEDGDRIAQMVIQRVEQITWDEVKELAPTERGPGGFGHTGTK